MKDLIIIGGGAAGIQATITAKDLDVLLIEREHRLGGILNQCIHNGFGLHLFKEELTGPEFTHKLVSELNKHAIEVLLDTSVIEINKVDHLFNITITNTQGLQVITSKAVMITSGSYERTQGAILLPGKRLKGITTAGNAQRYLNYDGYLVGKDIFILGSGDIGLIMARRLSLEGAKVHGVAEIMPHPNGLTRNIVQCLHDYDIPLYLSHTVTDVSGKTAVESITISEVDTQFNPIKGTEKTFYVDTLLLSVGLRPDIKMVEHLALQVNKKTSSASVTQNYQSSVEGLFFAGNALHIHDLVDYVAEEAMIATTHCIDYIQNKFNKPYVIKPIIAQKGIHYTIPDSIDYSNLTKNFELYFRTNQKATQAKFIIRQHNHIIKTFTKHYVQPAEMNKITIEYTKLIKDEPLTIEMEVVT